MALSMLQAAGILGEHECFLIQFLPVAVL